VIVAGVVLGIGLGAFIDGILLHQVLQWHDMGSSANPPTSLDAIELNVLWDGLFHAVAWVATFVGLLLLWRAGRQASTAWSARSLFGALLAGWGTFNLLEGIVNHQILGIHHVNETVPQEQWMYWDLGFLGLSALLLLIGVLVIRLDRVSEADTAERRDRAA
jgi:uncharacterized membrane protein